MHLLVEGEKDLRPFVPGDFNLPGFEREDVVVASDQLSVFLSPTGCKIGPREIQKQVLVIREMGEQEVEVQAGIGAGGSWWTGQRLRKVYEDIDYHLPWVQETVAKLERVGYFDKLISQMQKEYESGRSFVGELIPSFLNRFPEYDLIIDRFERYKDMLFVGSGSQQKAIHWTMDLGEFTVSVGEVREVRPDEEVDINEFTVDGKRYWVHDHVGVWYPTKDRDIAYKTEDMDRRTELLHLSFDTLENFLEQYYK